MKNEDSALSPREAAGVAELVDARDSKSRFLGSMGSIPIAGISSLVPFKTVVYVIFQIRSSEIHTPSHTPVA